MAKKTIYLVNPSSGSNVAGLTECMDLLGYRYLCANLSLPTLAALVDYADYEVTICDENADTIDFDHRCDIVGLTIYHYQRERTIEIAKRFKRQGVLVVVGGPYATQVLESDHPAFDVIFRGEAEHTWPEFLNDYLHNRHRRLYEESGHPDISDLPVPRFDMMRNARYLLGAIQASRGCPFHCDFCTSTVFYGRTMRYKPNDLIIAELEQLHGLGYRSVFILDDNFSGDRQRAKQILRAIRDWNTSKDEQVMFSTSASIDIASDPELASLFAESLVTNVFVGIETPNRASLASANKFQNLQSDSLRDVNFLHGLGIDVAAGIIVGFDDDDHTIFRRQFEFLQELCIPVCFVGMMLAPDGTLLKERLIREGRYLGNEAVRDHTFGTNVVPKHMTVEELRDGYSWLMNQLYDTNNYLERIRGILARFPAANPWQNRYKPREMRKPLKFVGILVKLSIYYLTNGAALRRMFFRAVPLLVRYRQHAATTFYWLIAYKHFREMLIQHGMFRQRDRVDADKNHEPAEARC